MWLSQDASPEALSAVALPCGKARTPALRRFHTDALLSSGTVCTGCSTQASGSDKRGTLAAAWMQSLFSSRTLEGCLATQHTLQGLRRLSLPQGKPYYGSLSAVALVCLCENMQVGMHTATRRQIPLELPDIGAGKQLQSSARTTCPGPALLFTVNVSSAGRAGVPKSG